MTNNKTIHWNKTFLLQCYGIDFAPIKRYHPFCFFMIVFKDAKIIPSWSLSTVCSLFVCLHFLFVCLSSFYFCLAVFFSFLTVCFFLSFYLLPILSFCLFSHLFFLTLMNVRSCWRDAERRRREAASAIGEGREKMKVIMILVMMTPPTVIRNGVKMIDSNSRSVYLLTL